MGGVISPDPEGFLVGIHGHDGTKWYRVKVDSEGKLLTVAELTPPAGGWATQDRQDTMIESLQKIDDLQQALESVGGDVLLVFDSQANTYLSSLLAELQEKLETTDISIDGDGHVQVDVQSSALPSGAATSAKQDEIKSEVAKHTPLDRNPSLVYRYSSFLAGTHGWTNRWNYTVPSGKKALWQTAQFCFDHPRLAGGDIFWRIRINNVESIFVAVDNEAREHNENFTFFPNIYLPAGTTLSGDSRSDTSGTAWFMCVCWFLEFS